MSSAFYSPQALSAFYLLSLSGADFKEMIVKEAYISHYIVDTLWHARYRFLNTCLRSCPEMTFFSTIKRLYFVNSLPLVNLAKRNVMS